MRREISMLDFKGKLWQYLVIKMFMMHSQLMVHCQRIMLLTSSPAMVVCQHAMTAISSAWIKHPGTTTPRSPSKSCLKQDYTYKYLYLFLNVLSCIL